MCNVHEFVPHLWVASIHCLWHFANSSGRSLCLLSVCCSWVVAMSYSWSRQWKTLWNHDGDKYQKACVDAWTQVADAWTQTTDDTVRPAYDVQAPYSRNRVFSDQDFFDACCSRNPVVPCYLQEGADSKWPMSKDAALPPPGLPYTPHSSWQTYTEPATQHDQWVFRRHVPAPPDEPLTLKSYVPEIIHNIQYRPPPQR